MENTTAYELAAAAVNFVTESEMNEVNAILDAEPVEYTEAELAEMEAEHEAWLATR